MNHDALKLSIQAAIGRRAGQRGTLKAEIPNVSEKAETLGDDPLAIYRPSGAKAVDAAKAMGNFTGWTYAVVTLDLDDQIIGPNFTDPIRMLANWGTIVSFNALGGMPTQETFTAMRANLTKSPGIRCFTLHTYDDDPNSIRRLIDETVDLFATSRIRPAIFERIPLSEARRAHQLLDTRKILGKVILKPE